MEGLRETSNILFKDQFGECRNGMSFGLNDFAALLTVAREGKDQRWIKGISVALLWPTYSCPLDPRVLAEILYWWYSLQNS